MGNQGEIPGLEPEVNEQLKYFSSRVLKGFSWAFFTYQGYNQLQF